MKQHIVITQDLGGIPVWAAQVDDRVVCVITPGIAARECGRQMARAIVESVTGEPCACAGCPIASESVAGG